MPVFAHGIVGTTGTLPAFRTACTIVT